MGQVREIKWIGLDWIGLDVFDLVVYHVNTCSPLTVNAGVQLCWIQPYVTSIHAYACVGEAAAHENTSVDPWCRM